MRNNWSGGQYSLFRGLLGAYLFVHFSYLAFWAAELFSSAGMLPAAGLSPLALAFPNLLSLYDAPLFVTALAIVGAGAAVAFTLGYRDRLAAIVLWYLLACFLGRNPLILNPSLPYVGWMLLAHLFVPPAPYGSLAARGRVDPDGGWRLPPALFMAAWAVLALSYSYSGYTKLLSPSWVAGDNVQYVLTNPLARDWLLRDLLLALPPICLKLLTWFILLVELLFAPLALSRRLRPWLWGGMLFVQFGFAFLLSFPDLTIAMLLFHLLTFDPGWLQRRELGGTVVYYDGTCALCHGTVRFLLAEDRSEALRFAPLQGAGFSAMASAQQIDPDSTFIVATAEGRLLTESDGFIHLLAGLGGLWRLAAHGLSLVPKRLRDGAYRMIGSRRHRLFGGTADLCPLLPPDLRTRFAIDANHARSNPSGRGHGS